MGKAHTVLKNKIIGYLKRNYRDCFVYPASDKWYKGIPDIYFLHNGVAHHFELKVLPDKPTKLQLYTIERIKSAGGIGGVCYSLDDVKDLLKVWSFDSDSPPLPKINFGDMGLILKNIYKKGGRRK